MGEENRKGLSRDTKILGATSFLTDVSTEMMVPLLPLFITQALGAPAFILGLIEGWAAVSVSLLDMASGWLSDKLKKRKSFLIAGYGLSTLTKPLFAFASAWPQMFLLRFIERMGKGIRRVPRDAMIGAAEPRANLGKAFGFRKMLDSAGAILGPLLAALLLFHFGGEMPDDEIYRTIFLLAAIPAAIGTLLLFLIKEKREELAKISSSARIVSKEFSGFLLVAAFFSIAQMGIAFFILRAGEVLPLVMVPIAYLAYNAAYTVFAMPAGILTDRFGPRAMLVFAYSLFGALCIMFAIFSGYAALLFLFALLGVFMAVVETTPRVYLVETTPGNKYATAIGTYQGVTGLLMLPANLVAGALWGFHVFGFHAPFVFSACIAILAAIGLLFFVKNPVQAQPAPARS